ncbi:hypothetical protein [Pedobacter montanisoli]|uniref:Outer membrane protein beta-barrel domain-containing protein n=1 Tax=Pedobacter montanisoli TaxID=2923277 RepID=A0ABS9ZWB8_9SPHI|nr:hypothetical protein [Pedobacter montanisoli]MCJ0742601.1 hypothetical protein [Pedobacter montanisoli]
MKFIRTVSLLSILFFFFCTVKIKAQTYMGLGAEMLLPSGNASNVSAIGLGASAKLEVTVKSNIALTGSIGFSNFFGRNYFGSKLQSIHAFPLKGGVKYYPTAGVYFEGQLGVALSGSDNTKNSFIWSPGLGTLLKSKTNNNLIDLGLRYEAWTVKNPNNETQLKSTNFGFMALRAAYNFNM